MAEKVITVLIVDDSCIFRTALEKILKEVNGIKVIGSVSDGKKALDFIALKKPDIVTLDVEMQGMDGLETLKEIKKLNSKSKDPVPMGVIMVSVATKKGADITIKAIDNGAFDFVEKPSGADKEENIKRIKNQLITKIHYYMSCQTVTRLRNMKQLKILEKNLDIARTPKKMPAKLGITTANLKKRLLQQKIPKIEAILIGVSTGGPKALKDIMPQISEVTKLPIFIVQHIPPNFSKSLADMLNHKCDHTVLEVSEELEVKENHMYLAPGGKHMVVFKDKKQTKVTINDQAPEHGCKPSVNVFFRSAAIAYEGNVVGIILTGMGVDGTDGCKVLKRKGAYLIAQDKKTSVVWGMPGSLVESGNADTILPLLEIPEEIEKILSRSKIT